MFFGKPWQDWIDNYQLSHQNKINQRFHLFGIPLVAVSIVLLLFSIVIPQLFNFALALFVVGWAFQFAGHWFEKKPPEFFSDWRYLFVGLRWWFQKVFK